MIDTRFKTVNFQGILLGKEQITTDDKARVIFQTRSGTTTLTVQSPILIPRLHIGVTYNIKGHERIEHGETYVRLMSAWPIIEQEPAVIRHSKKLIRGGVALVFITAFAAVPFTSPLGLSYGEETHTLVDTVDGSTDDQLQNLTDDSLDTTVQQSEQTVLPVTQTDSTAASIESTVNTSLSPEIVTPDPSISAPTAASSETVQSSSVSETLQSTTVQEDTSLPSTLQPANTENSPSLDFMYSSTTTG